MTFGDSVGHTPSASHLLAPDPVLKAGSGVRRFGLRSFAAAFALAASALAMPEPAICYDCPVNRHCTTDFDCSTYSCNLECAQIDRYGFDKRCLVP